MVFKLKISLFLLVRNKFYQINISCFSCSASFLRQKIKQAYYARFLLPSIRYRRERERERKRERERERELCAHADRKTKKNFGGGFGFPLKR